MATRYSKEKYACIKNLKNEPLSNLTADSKKRKLTDEKAETAALPPVHTTLSSPTPSWEVATFTPPTTHAKGKSKVGRSVRDDPSIAMGHVHNVITNDELKGLSSIPSHELVSHHIHKLVQVCGFLPLVSLLYFFVRVSVHGLPFHLLVSIKSLGSHYASQLTIWTWRRRLWWLTWRWNLSRSNAPSWGKI